MPEVATRDELVAELGRRRALVADAGRPEAVERQHRLGKLTARERIALLVDQNSFREFGAFADAAHLSGGPGEVVAPADGVVTGVGRIDGRPAVVLSFDFTVFGGSNGVTGGKKLARCRERARRDGLPLVMLLDGGGARIQDGLGSEHFAWGAQFFQEMAELSGFVPLVAVMMGPGFAGPSNFAALADLIVMVRGMSTMGIAGPALVQAATGERLSAEELGGADLQAALGITDLVVGTEKEALDAVRVFLGYLPASADRPAPRDQPREPAPGPDIDTLVPALPRQAYDVRPVIDAIADGDSVFELRPEHAPNVVTSLARLGGRPVGVIANQSLHLSGVLDSPACEKAAHFISLCDAYGLALVFLVDVPGFLAGSDSVTSQLVRRSGRMLFELGQATVPRYSVVLRRGYGTGYMAMAGGRSFSPDLALAWPTAEICAMSVEGAVDVAYRREVEAASDPAARRTELIKSIQAEVDPFLAARGFGIDDVIDPRETRAVLLDALEHAPERRHPTAPPKRHGISPI